MMDQIEWIKNAIDMLKKGMAKRLDSPDGKMTAYVIPKAKTTDKIIRIDIKEVS